MVLPTYFCYSKDFDVPLTYLRRILKSKSLRRGRVSSEGTGGTYSTK